MNPSSPQTSGAKPGTRPRVAVVQDGARLHYAVPVALHRAGMLEAMFTEWYVKPWSATAALARVASLVSAAAGRARERRHPEIPPARVHTNPLLLAPRSPQRRKFTHGEAWAAWCSDQTARWILRHGLGDANALYGFVRNIGPRLCHEAREQGLKVLTDQMIAPMAEEERQAEIQVQRWPGWHKMAASAGAAIVRDVEEQTWRASHHITCASDYVREKLIEQHVDAAKISVLPYPIDASAYEFVDRSRRPGPLVVGFVGAVGLRKGAPYFFEIARRLASERARFVMVGPVYLDPQVAGEKRGPVELIGQVPRSQVSEWLTKFDILLFPSTCEGSPGAVMEAMATGLPVVSTPNSGTVVRPGQEGFIHPYDDVDALAGAVERLLGDDALRLSMAQAARARAEAMTLDQYSLGLARIFSALVGTGAAGSIGDTPA